MKKRVLILGAGFLQSVALRSAKELGLYVIAVDGNPNAVSKDLADEFYPIDLKDTESLISLALRLKTQGGLDGVFTAATDFSFSVSTVAQQCHLPSHSLQAALNATDKVKMRECFKDHQVPSPKFISVDASSKNQANNLMKSNLSFPVVVKPVDNMGSRACKKVESQQDLGSAIDEAIAFSKTGRAIIEEYMDGPEFSLEALVYDGTITMTGFADRHVTFAPFFVEIGHTIPSSLDLETQKAVIAVFYQGIKALGLSHGVAKGDLKLTSKGPMIGEIAGRLSGGYMSGWTFPYSSGISLTTEALKLAIGEKPTDIIDELHWVSAERAWISIPGIIDSIFGMEKARTIPFLRDIFPRVRAGDRVKFPSNNVEKCGNCISAAPTREQAVIASESAVKNIVLRLQVPNKDTEIFLSEDSQKNQFPPNAFLVEFINESDQFVENSYFNFLIPQKISFDMDTLCDYHNLTLIEALKKACALEPKLTSFLLNSDNKLRIKAWNALFRGSIQGILYIYDFYSNEK